MIGASFLFLKEKFPLIYLDCERMEKNLVEGDGIAHDTGALEPDIVIPDKYRSDVADCGIIQSSTFEKPGKAPPRLFIIYCLAIAA